MHIIVQSRLTILPNQWFFVVKYMSRSNQVMPAKQVLDTEKKFVDKLFTKFSTNITIMLSSKSVVFILLELLAEKKTSRN